MHWSTSTLIPLLAGIAYGLLLLIVIHEGLVTPARRAFRIYLLTMFLSSMGSLITHSGMGDTLIWMRLYTAVSINVPLTIFHFVQNFLNKRQWWNRLAYTFGIAAVAIAIFTPYLIN